MISRLPHSSFGAKHFSTTACAAKMWVRPMRRAPRRPPRPPAPRQAPAVRRKELHQEDVTAKTVQITDQILPRRSTLLFAIQGEALRLNPDTALSLITALIQLGRSPPSSRVEEILMRHDSNVDDVFSLAIVCSRDPQSKELIKPLLEIAASGGHGRATIMLLNSAQHNGTLQSSKNQTLLKHAKSLADHGNANALLFEVTLESSKREKLRLLHQIIQLDVNNDNVTSISEAYLSLGKYKLDRGDAAGAITLLRRAAGLKQPKAHLYLARLAKPDSEAQHQHLRLAASANDPQAVYNLAAFYLRQTTRKAQQYSIDSDTLRQLAEDLYIQSARSGYLISRFMIAILMQNKGRSAESFQLLLQCEAEIKNFNPDICQHFQEVKANWNTPGYTAPILPIPVWK